MTLVGSKASLRPSLKVKLMIGAATGCMAMASPAFAQAQGEAAADAPEAGGVDTIVVTAQRVEQRLQDVPVSVTAISGDALRDANVTNIDRIEQLAPGIRIGRSGSDSRPAIRGTFTENIAANGDPRIGFYVDDVYQSRTSQALVAFTDVERVEVQKGPQGTLYGRNSFGGNIAVFSATPKDDFSAGVDALYGNYDRKRIEGFVNVPLTEGISTRVAGLWEKADGYVKNLGTGSDLGDEDQYYVRGSVRIAPASLPDLEIVLRGSYWNQDGNGFSGFGYKSIGTLVDVPLIRQPGGSIVVGGQTYDFPNGFNGNSFSGTPFPINSRYRDGIADINGADIGVPVAPGPYRIDSDVVAFRKTRQQQYSASINYDAGPVNLRSITSYTKFYANRSADQDFSPAPLATDFNETRNQTFTQELQLLSSDRGSPLQWIIGGYYFQDKTTEKFYIEQNRNYSTAIALATGQLPLYSFSFSYFPTLAANGFGQYRNDSINPVRAKTKSYAAYAQASYTFNDKLTVTAGYRYTSDRKRYAALFGAPGFFPLTAPAGSTLPAYVGYSLDMPINFACGGLTAADPARSNLANVNGALITRCARKTFNYSTFRGALDYKITPDNMVYMSVSTGRHAGGFNNTLNPLSLEPIAFDPEKVIAYEVGSKNRFLDGTLQLNLAAFYNDYKDLQVQTSIPNPQGTGVLGLVSNAGRSKAYGIELEAIAKPARNLTVNFAFNWLHARETEYQVNTFGYFGGFGICTVSPGPACATSPAAGVGVQGTPFPNPVSNPGRFVPVLGPNGQQIVAGGVPQFNYVIAGTGADGQKYESHVALSPTYTVQAGIAYDIDLGGAGTLTPSVQTYFNSGYILTDLTPNFGDQSAYTKTDIRLTYVSPDERYTVQAYVENLENTAVINRVAFGNFRSLNGSYAAPRTYGVKVGARF